MKKRERKTDQTRPRMVFYIRVSTEHQADYGHSLEAQQECLMAYAKALGLEVAAIEVDAGLSAATLERPALQRALAALESGQASGILVTRLDRLTRSVKDFSQLVHRYFTDGACRLMSVSESIDTATPAGRLVLNVLMAVSEWEREAAAQRTSTVMKRLKASGKYTGGFPPFGWTVDEEGALVPNMREQAVITRAKELRTVGMSLRDVAGTLGANPRTGNGFDAKAVQRMVQ